MTTTTPALTGTTRQLLAIFQTFGWHVTSMWLARHSEMLGYRARITDLRQKYGLRIDATWVIVNAKKRTTFTLHENSRGLAAQLLMGKEKE